MFKIETHLHTKIISKCGWMYPDEILQRYHNGGYSGICVTDHFNRTCFDYANIDLNSTEDKVGPYLEGYAQMKKAAEKYGIQIYEGAELRFDQNDNDYLVYGFSRKLFEDPDSVMKMGLQNFIQRVRDDGALLIQAHPFRASCMPAPAEYLDGLEVCNANPRHADCNDMARAYAERHGLIQSGGSDCHRPGDECRSGILSETLPMDSHELAQLLRSGNYTVIDFPDAP